jgi:lipid-binding SYLF domain-containing protein
MLHHYGKTVGGMFVVLCLVSTVAVAVEMTCRASDGKGNCTAASGPDGREVVVVGEGLKPGDKMECVVRATLIDCMAQASPDDKAALVADATARLQQMQSDDPSLGALLQRGAGYALFPNVSKAGLLVGGAHGWGVVYDRGQHIGYSALTQATVGIQAGAQSYSEILVFETKDALERFKAGQFGLAADASAVALKSGATANANFVNGVAAVVEPLGGVMVAAAIGGQQFSYQPK